MDLSCPRCGTDLSSDALYCSYCTLPKPKNGFTAAPEAEPEEAKLTEQATHHIGIRNSKVSVKQGKPPAKLSNPERKPLTPRPIKRQRSAKSRNLLPIVAVATLVALLAVGVYIFVVPMINAQQAEPKVVLSALDALRKMPSNEEGLTIDARLKRELDTARRVKNLVSYQGWTAQPIKGTKTKVLLVYSYQEVGDVNKRAEWIADLTNNNFEPQTELAQTISIRPPAQ